LGRVLPTLPALRVQLVLVAVAELTLVAEVVQPVHQPAVECSSLRFQSFVKISVIRMMRGRKGRVVVLVLAC
jgi:hypothetical protein